MDDPEVVLGTVDDDDLTGEERAPGVLNTTHGACAAERAVRVRGSGYGGRQAALLTRGHQYSSW